MVDYDESRLDTVFAALSDSTRRQVLAQLAQGHDKQEKQVGRPEGFTVTELAQPHGMSLPGFMKHLAVLEAAGLIARSKEGRVVRCQLEPARLQEAALWISRYERFWTEQLDALGRFLYHQEEVSPWTASPPTPHVSSPPTSPSPAPTASPRTKSGAPGRTRRR